MKHLLLLIGLLYTMAATSQVAPTTDVTLHMNPEKGGLVLSINFDKERFLISDSAEKTIHFEFTDGTSIRYELGHQPKSRFNKVLKKINSSADNYFWVKTGGLSLRTNSYNWRLYKYTR